jgi:hypothetical protein
MGAVLLGGAVPSRMRSENLAVDAIAPPGSSKVSLRKSLTSENLEHTKQRARSLLLADDRDAARAELAFVVHGRGRAVPDEHRVFARSDSSDDLESAESGHVKVDDDDVRREVGELFESLDTVGGFARDRVAIAFQHDSEKQTDVGVIIDDQDVEVPAPIPR